MKKNSKDFKKLDLSPDIKTLIRIKTIRQLSKTFDLSFKSSLRKKVTVINPKLNKNVPTTFSL